jgi:hypothetical protein
MPDAIFVPQPDGSFLPTEFSRSAWGTGLVHGGPPAGLLARAIERDFLLEGWHPARLTVDLFRPVPVAPLTVVTKSVRSGRRIHAVEAAIVVDGAVITRATAVLLKEADQPYEVPGKHGAAPSAPPPGSADDVRPLADPTSLTAFHTTVKIAWTDGDRERRDGRSSGWMRVPLPMIESEEISPFVHAALLSDFGNALGGVRLGGGVGFINVDISLYISRLPKGDWIHLASVANPQTSGIGFVETQLADEGGPFGRIVQATLANPRN